MIAFLKGILIHKTPLNVQIECHGVGYELFIPLSTLDMLPQTGEQVRLHVYYSFNESDGARLFGFYTPEEKELFRELISISKIGPKIALSILSALSVKDFVKAVQSANIHLISTVPGIGKKSAERLIIELKDRISKILSSGEELISLKRSEQWVEEAESALLTLGYKAHEVRKALATLIKEQKFTSPEELIKAAIKYLYKK